MLQIIRGKLVIFLITLCLFAVSYTHLTLPTRLSRRVYSGGVRFHKKKKKTKKK